MWLIGADGAWLSDVGRLKEDILLICTRHIYRRCCCCCCCFLLGIGLIAVMYLSCLRARLLLLLLPCWFGVLWHGVFLACSGACVQAYMPLSEYTLLATAPMVADGCMFPGAACKGH